MRTVSFSTEPVQQLLKNDFVCATINIDGDPTAGASLAHAPTDSCGRSSRGIGRSNVQCLFLTPGGEILHVASGYVGPNDLEKEIRFAKEAFEAVKKSPENGKSLVAAMHAKRLKSFDLDRTAAKSRTTPIPSRAGRSRVVRTTGFDRRARGRRVTSVRDIQNMLAQRQQSLRNRMNDLRTTREKMLANDGDNFDGNSGIFSSFGRRAVKSDHEFSVEHPLYSMSDFLSNPRVLIGNEQTAYGSVGPGGASGGTIGGNSTTRFEIRK